MQLTDSKNQETFGRNSFEAELEFLRQSEEVGSGIFEFKSGQKLSSVIKDEKVSNGWVLFRNQLGLSERLRLCGSYESERMLLESQLSRGYPGHFLRRVVDRFRNGALLH